MHAKYCGIWIKIIVFTHLLNGLYAEPILWLDSLVNLITGGPCAARPKNFPPGIPLRKTTFRNWNGEITKELWEAIPLDVSGVLKIANWAFASNYKVRAKGSGFSWSPLTVTSSSDCSKYILVDLTKHFTSIHIADIGDSDPNSKHFAVLVQAGASMNSLLQYLENIERGLMHTPVVGDITVGGTFGLANHGFGVPAYGEVLPPGLTYGSLSNAIISLTAIVWDDSVKAYVAKQFLRHDKETSAFLCHLGRTLVIDYVIRVGPNYNMRCILSTDIPSSELFSLPGRRGVQAYTGYLDAGGRNQAITFPLSTIKKDTLFRYCSVRETKPPESLEVRHPYNYPYLDSIPAALSDVLKTISLASKQLTPSAETGNVLFLTGAIAATKTGDLWGLSKNHLLFIKSTSLRITASGYAILTSRKSVQRVIHDFSSFYLSLLNGYIDKNEYPMSGPYEVRVTGVDKPEDVLIPGASAPTLSPSRPYSKRPEFDTVVWIDLTTFPDSPNLNEFMEEVKMFLFSRFNGHNDGLVRPEWSKRFAFTKEGGPFTNISIMKTNIPESYENGKEGWYWANLILQNYDPHSIFSNEFLDKLFN